MKRIIEVFTAGCAVCEPVVESVKEMACDACEVTIYNLSQPCDTKECLEKVKKYNITSLPAIVVNGELLSCCTDREVKKETLTEAGIGQAV
jgi:hypothetical protein